MAKLVFEQEGQRVELVLDRAVLRIGRGAENDLQIRDLKASRFHCRIERTQDGRMGLIDLQSGNGTKVNGRLVEQCELGDGDAIQIGDTELRFFREKETACPGPSPAPGTSRQAEKVPATISAADTTGDLPTRRRRTRTSKLALPVREADPRSGDPRSRWTRRSLLAAAIIGLVAGATLLALEVYQGHREKKEAENLLFQARTFQRDGQGDQALEVYRDLLARFPESQVAPAARAGLLKGSKQRSDREAEKTAWLACRQECERYGADPATQADLLRRFLEANAGGSFQPEARSLLGDVTRALEELEQGMFAQADEDAGKLLKEGRFGEAYERWGRLRELVKGSPDGVVEKKMQEVWARAHEAWRSSLEKISQLEREQRLEEAVALCAEEERRLGGGLAFSWEARLRRAAIERWASPSDPKVAAAGPAGSSAATAMPDDTLGVLAEVEEHRRRLELERAAALLTELSSRDSLSPVLAEELRSRAADLRTEARLLENLIAAANEKKLRPHAISLGENLRAQLAAANETHAELEFPGGRIKRPWISFSARELVSLFRTLPLLGPDELYAAAAFALDHPDCVVDAHKTLYEFTQAAPDRQSEAFALLARVRKVPVPAEGFRYLEGNWFTAEEHARVLLEKEARTVAAKVGGDPATWKQGYARYEAFAAAHPVPEAASAVHLAKQALSEAFLKKRSELVKRLGTLPRYGMYQKLKLLKQELNRRRKEALDVIFNKEIYPDENHGVKGQKFVDEKVDLVRDLWDKPMRNIVRLDGTVRKTVEQIRELDGYLKQLGAKRDKSQRLSQVLASLNDSLTLKTITLDSKERRILEHNREVRSHNEKVKSKMSKVELDQLEVTNEYREMMGLRMVYASDALAGAARKHTENMAAAGHIWHDGPDGSPASRCKEAGFVGAVGENCAQGYGSPKEAFHGWYTSSGHHRNMLHGSWNQLGVGQVSGFWTQNFGHGPLPASVRQKANPDQGSGRRKAG